MPSSPRGIEERLEAARRYEECQCRYRGMLGIIERVYRGRGVRQDHVRAKIHLHSDDAPPRILHVDFDEITPF
jgi:hypothetical protein